MPQLRALLPGVTILTIVLLAALPWGLPGASRFVLPLVPFAVIFYWLLQRQDLVPDWLVFLAGLMLDVLTDGPLGLWPLVYLVGYALTITAWPWAGAGRLRHWALFAAVAAMLAGAEFLVSLVYFGVATDSAALARAVLWVVLIYPVIAAVLAAFSGVTGVAQIERGG